MPPSWDRVGSGSDELLSVRLAMGCPLLRRRYKFFVFDVVFY